MITVLSKFEARNYVSKKKNASVIRISSIYPLIKLKDCFKNEIKFYFDDIIEDKDSEKLITKKEAEEILIFVKENYTEDSELVIHCDYGKGRSPGVAEAISIILRKDFDKTKFKDINYYVSKKILEVNREKRIL